jgi:hypothetical protein
MLVMIENNWREKMRNSMKRSNKSWKMIDLEINMRKELEKLWELQIRGRLVSRCLKERFGKKDESSEGSKQAEVMIGEGIRIGAISGE